MKYLLLTICAICFSIQILGQSLDTIYFDKQWQKSTSQNYKFYRVARPYKDLIQVIDYYKSGKIQMTGTYKSLSFNDATGQFFYYKENGRIYHQDIYEPIKYPGLLKDYIEYLKLIAPIPDSSTIGIYFNKKGKIFSLGYTKTQCNCLSTWLSIARDGSPLFQKSFYNNKANGLYIFYHGNWSKWTVGQYENGKKSGEWIYYDVNGNVTAKVNHSKK